MTEQLRVLVYPINGILVGQCLEHDVCSRGETIEDVRRRMKVALNSYEADGISLSSIPKAPNEYFTAWDEAPTPPFKIDLGGEHVEFRQALAA